MEGCLSHGGSCTVVACCLTLPCNIPCVQITSGQFSLAQRLALQGAQSRRAWVRESAAIFIGKSSVTMRRVIEA